MAMTARCRVFMTRSICGFWSREMAAAQQPLTGEELNVSNNYLTCAGIKDVVPALGSSVK